MDRGTFEKSVAESLRKEGWSVYHAGIPDFFCVKKDSFKFVEAKSVKDKIAHHQLETFNALLSVGLQVEVVWEEGARKYRFDKQDNTDSYKALTWQNTSLSTQAYNMLQDVMFRYKLTAGQALSLLIELGYNDYKIGEKLQHPISRGKG